MFIRKRWIVAILAIVLIMIGLGDDGSVEEENSRSSRNDLTVEDKVAMQQARDSEDETPTSSQEEHTDEQVDEPVEQVDEPVTPTDSQSMDKVSDIPKEPAIDESMEPQDTSSFDGSKLIKDDYVIEITDVKVYQTGHHSYSDDPTLAFWFDITASEHTSADITPNGAWISSFIARQDNDPNAVNDLKVGSLPDSAHGEVQMQTLKPGGTVSSSMSYQLDDISTPVELIAVKNRITDESYGFQTYTLQ